MISLFLTCAMSLPASSFRAPLSVSEVRLVHRLMDYDPEMRPNSPQSKHVVMIGVSPQWAMAMRGMGIRAWRIVFNHTQTPWDIYSSIFVQPFHPASIGMVVYGLSAKGNKWVTMRTLAECTLALTLNGYIVFDQAKCPDFPKYLKRMWFDRLPFSWNGWEIWQRHRYRDNGNGIIVIRHDLPGNFEKAWDAVLTSA